MPLPKYTDDIPINAYIKFHNTQWSTKHEQNANILNTYLIFDIQIYHRYIYN